MSTNARHEENGRSGEEHTGMESVGEKEKEASQAIQPLGPFRLLPKILIHESLLSFLRGACSTRVPGRSFSEVAQFKTALDDYTLSMASNNVVSAIVGSLESRRTLLELSSQLGLANDPKLRAAQRTDDERIAANLISIFNSKDEEDVVLRLEGDPAQYFLDVVQETLDQGLLLEENHSRMARRMIRKLSERCDMLPSSLFITGVSGREEHPTFGGGYGDIFRASYNEKPVALKRMRYFLRGAELRRVHLKFCREALVWKDLRHPHILSFLGIDRNSFPATLCMVSPWMKHGTVMNYLQRQGHANVDKLASHFPGPVIYSANITLQLYEIAQGLHYLHSCNIVHGDLRGANILVNEDWSACLADFGLSNFADATSSMTTNRAGSLYWMAPELIDPDRFGLQFARTPATDVYAFGCVCLELYTGRPPFADLREPTALLKIMNNERPQRPVGPPVVSDTLWSHISAWWADDPRVRPGTQLVVQIMKSLHSPIVPPHLQRSPPPSLSMPSFLPTPMAAPTNDQHKPDTQQVQPSLWPSPRLLDSMIPDPVPSSLPTPKMTAHALLPHIDDLWPPHIQTGDRVGEFEAGPNYGPVLEPLLVRAAHAKVRLNPLIQPVSDSLAATPPPYLKWNMLFPSNQCRRSDEPVHVTMPWSNGRAEPATFPRVSLVRLVSDTFPFVITVPARNRDIGVTCGDLIDYISRDMYQLASQAEYEALPANKRRIILEAYRYNRSHADGVPGAQLHQGMLRLDWFGQDTMFGGIRNNRRLVRLLCGGDVLPCTFELVCLRRYPQSFIDDIFLGADSQLVGNEYKILHDCIYNPDR
ncbi:Kinase-like protein [Mycena sanguinolenta]|uniref:Kinase-like protein n=1 Tax=Mycena sanguinolenta TaxID=230812 RepID=A0A8H7DIF3_9AGAR|nr:Kinase-like protein [Mycena sanguinolenta]